MHAYLEYIQHVVVADETFFGTVIRNTEYCTKHHNQNFLHLQFDEWESELPAGERDPQKVRISAVSFNCCIISLCELTCLIS